MTLCEFLRRQASEDLPEWLENHRGGNPFPREQFFASRVVYYPGSGTDGHPVKVFGSTHSAHCFVYADYGLTQQQLEEHLNDRYRRFRGYYSVDRLQLQERDIVPNGWTPHVSHNDLPRDRFLFAGVAGAAFGFLEVLERNKEYDDSHGARRLAVLFLGADGIASYDALFCQGQGTSLPFAVLLQDHGFGGNYDKFERGGLLESLANTCQVFPTWLLVAEHTDAWDGYRRVRAVDGDVGGVRASPRFLYERDHRRGNP